MTAVTALPLTYKGIRFRSHLEADWASTFDTLRWAWSYEPEPYAYGRRRYLPDFYLPHMRAWVEVKGWHNERLHKPQWFAAQLDTDALLVCRPAGPGHVAQYSAVGLDTVIEVCLRCGRYVLIDGPHRITDDQSGEHADYWRCRLCGNQRPMPPTALPVRLARAPRPGWAA